MGRPQKDIDPEQVAKMAKIGCSGDEIAAVLGCSRDLLYKRFSTVLKSGHEELKASLRRWQYVSGSKGNVTMQIWLGKQLLGQTDHNRIEVSGSAEIVQKLLEGRKRLAKK